MSTPTLRALELLEHVQAGPLPVAELARRTGQDKGSVSRTASTLVSAGWLSRVRGGVGLGPRAVLLGGHPHLRQALDRARELVHAVSGLTGLSVGLSVLAGNGQCVVAVATGPEGAPDYWSSGADAPLWATACGVAILAQLSDDDVAALLGDAALPQLAHRTPDRAGVLAAVADARERGVVVDRGWSHDGARCVAVPYEWFDGTPAAMCVLAFEGVELTRMDFAEAQLRIAAQPGATRTTLIEECARRNSGSHTTGMVDVVRAALRVFHDSNQLAACALAPMDGPVVERAATVRARLLTAVDAAFDGGTDDDAMLRRIVHEAYLRPGATHTAAMRALHLGRSTYYRRLGVAVARVTDHLSRV